MARYFIWAPMEVLLDSRLTDAERRVLLALYSFRDSDSDRVWPKVERLAARSQIRDLTRLSKITGRLQAKGWLLKKRRGYTGRCIFTLLIPPEAPSNDGFHAEPVLADKTKTQLAEGAKTGTAVLAETTKTYLAESAKNNELTNEHYSLSHKNIIPLGNSRGSLAAKNIGDSGWHLGSHQLEELQRIRPDLLPDAEVIAAMFLDTMRSTDKLSADFDAEWRIWLRRENPVNDHKTHNHLVRG